MEPENKTELLNKQFEKVFMTDDGNTPSISYFNILSKISDFVDLDITVDIVFKSISSLKSSVSDTLDQIQALF